MDPPYVAKPISEGSSVGVVIVNRGANRPPEAIRTIPVTRDGEIMVETYVPGRELTCGVIGDTATNIIDIVPAEGLEFYDYEAKYAPGGSKHILPAQIPAHVREAVRRHTLAAHRALGCRGISRCDFRWDGEKDELVFCAALGSQYTYGFATFVRQPARQKIRIGDVDRNEQLAGWLPLLVIELFDGRPDQFFVGRIGGFKPEEVLAADQQAAAHEQQLQIDGGPVACDADDILTRQPDGNGLVLDGRGSGEVQAVEHARQVGADAEGVECVG